MIQEHLDLLEPKERGGIINQINTFCNTYNNKHIAYNR